MILFQSTMDNGHSAFTPIIRNHIYLAFNTIIYFAYMIIIEIITLEPFSIGRAGVGKNLLYFDSV